MFKTLVSATEHSKEPHFRCIAMGCLDMFQSKQAMLTHSLKTHFCCGVCRDGGKQEWAFRNLWEVEGHFREVVGEHYYCWLCTELFLERKAFERHHEVKHRAGRKVVEEEVE